MSLSYEDLNDKVIIVNNKLSKYQTLFEENEKRLNEIKKRAKEEYGVDTLEELRGLLSNLLKEEEAEFLRVEEEIKKAEPILEEIANGLKELEA